MNKIVPECINNIDNIILDKHAIIEASAGTGKTTTIQKLFIRLILEKNIDIEKILVMTFTEMATSELKGKIRKEISDTLQKEYKEKVKDINKITKLTNALNYFHNSQIYTIHGFCSNVVNDYPFENKLYFNTNLIDDTNVYEKTLKNIMRKDWADRYAEDLTDILLISEVNENWIKEIIKFAKKYNDIEEINDLTIPLYDKNFTEKIKKIKAELKKINHEELIKKLNIKNINYIEESEIYEIIKNSIRGNSLKKYTKVLNMIIKFIKKNVKNFYDYYCFIINFFKITKSYDYLLQDSVILKEKLEIFKNNNSITVINNAISEIKNIFNDIELLSMQLFTNTVIDMKIAVDNYKKENGLMSFNDLLKYVYLSLNTSENLKNELQKKYDFALIDEFQDTDNVQWQILKKIFLESKDKIIFLIGDPKQAIYGFRGADVNTYLKAKEEILIKNKSSYYFLDTNYRSNREIVLFQNKLFGFDPPYNNKWFTDDKIEKIASKPSDKIKISIEDNLFKSVNFIELPEKNVAIINDLMSEFISIEITRLVLLKITDSENKNNSLPNIRYEDIAVLTRKTKEQKIIEEKFIKYKIPYTIYKKSELYKSDEAFHLFILLDSISNPMDKSKFKKALLTDFFDINLEKLTDFNDVPEKSKINDLFSNWFYSAEKMNWPKLFNSVIEDSGIFIRLINKQNSERKITNYKHIIENLLRETSKYDYNIYDIAKYLFNLITSNIKDEIDSDLHRLETEDSKVKILTIHAAKGLQYPIVFVFGGFSKGSADSFYKFHDNDKNKIIYDLLKNEDNKTKHDNEKNEEDQRLYYVAVTRAKAKIYIPYLNKTKSKNAGPMANFIKNCIDNAIINNDEANVINSENYLNNYSKINKEHEQSDINKKIDDSIIINDNFLDDIISNIKIIKDEIFSFSSLNKEHESNNILNIADIKFNYKEDDDKNLINQVIDDDFKKQILPKGPETGILFHEILEELDFKKFDNDINKVIPDKELNSFLTNKIEKYQLRLKQKTDIDLNSIKNEIIKILHITLNKDLGFDDLKLVKINNKDRIKEFEFYYNLKNSNIKSNIYLNGFIDLLFRYKNKYFILDWKTNCLENYDKDSIKKEMNKENYYLQMQIYLITVVKWLEKKIKNFDFQKNFGGVIYLFLRGINDLNNYGIYYFNPENMHLINDYIKEINDKYLIKDRYGDQ